MAILNRGRGRGAGVWTLVGSFLARKHRAASRAASGHPHEYDIEPELQVGRMVSLALTTPVTEDEWTRLERPYDGSTDTWYFRPESDLPGDQKCLLVIERPDGTYYAAYGVEEWLDELKRSSPTQHFLLRKMLAEELPNLN